MKAFLFILLFFGLEFTQIIAQDIIISDRQVYSDTTIIISGNIIIESEGILELSNVTLKMNCQEQGQYKIEVKPGGEMTVSNNSSISAVDPDAPFAFTARGKKFTMTNSSLSGVGWGSKGEDVGSDEERENGEKGLYMGTDSAFIDNNTFSENYCGIILSDTSITFSNNTVNSNIVHGIYLNKANYCAITGNSIQHGEGEEGSATIRIVDSYNNIIGNNTIISKIHTGVIESMGSNGNRYEENSISGFGVGILLMFLSSDNVVSGNTISVDEAGIMVWGWNNQVLDNNINDNHSQVTTGIYMVYSYNSLISGNTFSNIAGHGIWLRHSSNNKIINNTATAREFSANYSEPDISGIFLYRKCKHNILQNNNIINYARGISLHYECDSNYVTENTVSDILYQGLILDNSKSNYILTDNEFINCNRDTFSNSDNHSNYNGNIPFDNTASKLPVVSSTGWNDFDGHLLVEGQAVYFSNAHVLDGDTLILKDMTLYTGRTTNDVSGLEVHHGGTLILDNCKFIHSQYGNGFVFGAVGGTLIMKDCSFFDCGQEWWYGGIQIKNTDNTELNNNTFYGTIISLFGTDGATISNNKFYDSYTVLNLEDANNVTFYGNIIDRAARTAIIGGNSNIVVIDNTIKNIWGKGIHIWNTNTALVEGNKLSNIQEPYPAIDNSGEYIISQNNEVTNSYQGINNGGQYGKILDNKIYDCTIGMEITETTVVKDNIVKNCYNGIGGDSIINNQIFNCDIGIGGNYLKGNRVDSCRIGIYGLHNVAHATENVISDCDTGVYLANRGNIFHHNEIFYNKIQAYDDNEPGTNSWDYNGYGNFWSDYAGPDNNGDGIGDIPHIFPPIENKDNFPLLEPTKTTLDPIFLKVIPESLSPVSFNAGDKNIAIASLHISTESADSTPSGIWGGIQLKRTGTGNDNVIESIKIWKDLDNNNFIEPESDSLIASGNFVDSLALIMFDRLEKITNDSNCYIISIDLAQSISKSDISVGIALYDSTYFICPYPVKTKNENLPFYSNQLVVSNKKVYNQMFNLVCFPNPFNEKLSLQFSLHQNDDVLIQVLNLNGQIVKTILDDYIYQGKFSLVWNGSDDFGNQLNSGAFFIRVITPKRTLTKKVIFME